MGRTVSETVDDMTRESVEELRKRIDDLDHRHSGNVGDDLLGNLKTISRLENIEPKHHEKLDHMVESAVRNKIRSQNSFSDSLEKASNDPDIKGALEEIESIQESTGDLSIGIELELPAYEGFMSERDVSDLNMPSRYGDMVVMENGPNTAEIRTGVHNGPMAAVESVLDTYEIIEDEAGYDFEDTSIPMNNPMDAGLGIDSVQSQFPGLHVHIGAPEEDKGKIAEGVMQHARELAFLSTGFESSDYDPEDNSLSLRQLRTKGGGGMKGQITSREDMDTLEYRMFDATTEKEKMLPIVGALTGLHKYYQNNSKETPETEATWSSTADGPSISLPEEEWEEYKNVLTNKNASERFLDYSSMREKISQGLEQLDLDKEKYLEKLDEVYTKRRLSVRYWESPTSSSLGSEHFAN